MNMIWKVLVWSLVLHLVVSLNGGLARKAYDAALRALDSVPAITVRSWTAAECAAATEGASGYCTRGVCFTESELHAMAEQYAQGRYAGTSRHRR